MGGVAGARRGQRPQYQTEDVHGRRDPGARRGNPERHAVVPLIPMVALILTTLWVLGAVSSYTLGGFLHVFLLVAIVMMLPRVIRGRKAAR